MVIVKDPVDSTILVYFELYRGGGDTRSEGGKDTQKYNIDR